LDIENTSRSEPLLKVEPENIDFGCLKPGEGGNVTLKVCGGPGDVLVHTDQLKIVPINFGIENSELQVTLLAGSAGELIWDNIVVKGENGELSLLVTARWEEKDTIEAPPTPPPQPVSPQVQEKRGWKGRKCSRCGKNFAYLDLGSWEQCHCTWYQVGINTSSRIIKELRYGIKVHISDQIGRRLGANRPP